MSEKTHAEIIEKMKCGPIPEHRHDREILRLQADQLDAAHKREMDALKQRCAELDAEVAAKDEVIKRLNDAIAEEQRRKMATAEKSSAVGDCAKLREALTKVKEWMELRIATCGYEFSATLPTMLEDVVLPALAAPATTEKSSAVGNAAKLRETLSKSCAYFAVVLNTGMFNRVHLEALLNMANAALAAPPRNCDVGTAEEQYSRMFRECYEWMCMDCKQNKDLRKCALSWAQKPYKKGSAE